MIALFILGNLWIAVKEIEYGERRYFSEWTIFAAKMPEVDKIDRELAVGLLRKMNIQSNKRHKSYFAPWLLVLISASVLICSREKRTEDVSGHRDKQV